MTRVLPSIAFVLFLGATLGAKSLGYAAPDAPDGNEQPGFAADFLSAHGFVVTAADASSAPAWISGTRDRCQVQVADVSPQGWYRTIVTEQAQGQELHYAYAGRLHDDQPVLRTTIDDYRRRLARYVGIASAPLPLRAIVLSPECSPEILPRKALEVLG